MLKRGRTRIEETIEESEDLFDNVVNNKKQCVEDNSAFNDGSLFCKELQAAGFILKKGESPNVLECDQAVFKRSLWLSLKSHDVYSEEEFVTKLLEGFNKYIESYKCFKWTLLYTQKVADCASARGAQQDSLVRLLLNLDEIQPQLIRVLVEKFIELVYSEDEGKEVSEDIPQLILANLRWLDHITDSTKLTDNMTDLLIGAPVQIQQEVISFLPHIVDDTSHSKISKILCDLYDSTLELIPSILEAWPYLNLETGEQSEIRHSVLKVMHATKVKDLPVVVKFLLHNMPKNTAFQELSDMREKMHLPGSDNGRIPSHSQAANSEDTDMDIIIFFNIKTAVLIHKFLATEWLKVIDSVDKAPLMVALDVLVLVVFYESLPAKRKPIESIIRNKIRTNVLTESLLEITFAKHGSVFAEYFKSVKKITSILIRSGEPAVRHFGRILYRLSFECLSTYHQQEVVRSLLTHIGDSEATRAAALETLVLLAHSHTNTMCKYAIFLKGSLDFMDLLGMSEVKQLLDVISLVAYADNNNMVLQEELAILVRKQLSHINMKYKRIGVMISIMAVKNMVGSDDHSREDSEMSNDSSGTDILNTSVLQEAGNQLRMVVTATYKAPMAFALFMDELASTVLSGGMNHKIEKWINEKIISKFQDTFVLDNGTELPECQLPIDVRWDLEEENSEGAGIVINLAPLAVADEENRANTMDGNGRIIVLCPEFRLVRMIESHLNEGDLGNIDALLGCPVYAPSEETINKFESLSQKEQHGTLSCLFYTVNWFRELLNAFVTQKDTDLKVKVHKRLKQVIAIQKILSKLLPKCPSYIPPPAIFDTDPAQLSVLASASSGSSGQGKKTGRKPGGGKKGKKKGKGAEETKVGPSQGLSQVALTQTPKENAEKDVTPTVADIQNYRAFLRELDIDVFCLLFRTLALHTELENQAQLTLSEAEFLLADLNLKLSHIFDESGKKMSHLGRRTEKGLGFSHLDIFSAAEVAKQAHRFLKPVCIHLEKICGFYQGLIQDNDGILDAPGMFSDDSKPLTVVYTHLFTTVATFFTWEGLKQQNNSTIFTAVLQTVAKRLEGDAVTSMDTEDLISSVFRYLSNFHEYILNIETAVVFIKALNAVTKLSKNNGLKNKLMDIVEALLKREWYTSDGDPEKGSLYNQHILTLLQVYFGSSDNVLPVVSNITNTAFKEFVASNKKDQRSEAFPTLHKGTLIVYLKTLLEYLIIGVKGCACRSSIPTEERLVNWCTAVKVFHVLINILQEFRARTYLGSGLKYSRIFLEVFIRSAMPLLDSSLRHHNQEVVTILKTLQTSTRFLHHICTHSKVSQDTSLIRHVPAMKKALETLIYRVKAMLAVNKCEQAFWMGNLKNRDLQGEELCSQVPRQDENGNQEEEEEEQEEEEEYQEEESDVDLDDDNEGEKSAPKEKKKKDDNEEEQETNYSSSF